MAPTPDSPSTRALQLLRAELRHAGERRLVLIEGSRSAALNWLAAELPFLSADQGLWVSTKADSPLPALHVATLAQARTWLGRELDLLVWDGFSGNPPDGLAALAGTLTAGGLWFWLMPPLAQWGTFADPDYARTGLDQASEHPFAERLARILCDAPDVIRLDVSGDERASATINSELGRVQGELSRRRLATAFCVSGGPEQDQLVQALVRFGLGRRRRPLVVTADRGRGKSAALGLAAAELLLQGRQRVLLTAPSAKQVSTVMAHARERLGAQLQSQSATELTTTSGASLTFLLPQQLLADKPAAEIVMVDEAAAIAAPLLQRILLGWPRVAFATTVHGYEGAGRGFAVRFREQLDQHTPHWQERTLSQPVRWAAGDPLEPLVFRLFLLAAQSPSNTQQQTPDPSPVLEVERWQPAQATENDLAEAFGLLVDAHYRTTPADLRQWLDDPAAVSWRARTNGRTVGLLWAQGEGEFSAPLAQQVSLGQRRLRGHLLAQSLALHAGLPQAARQRSLRVTRIAVAAPQRRSGIGQRLIAAAQAYAKADGFDYIGSSFGGTPALLAFWQRQGLQPVRLGFSQEASSGEYPLQAVCGLSAAGERLVQDLQQRLGRHWLVLASRQWGQCQPELMAAVMRSLPAGPQLDAEDSRDLRYFAAGHRGFELTLPALQILSRCAGAADWLAALQPAQCALWCRSVVQGRSWAELQRENLCSGQRDAEQQLRFMVAGWCCYHPRHADGVLIDRI
ncbi:MULTISPECIES: GNAT family N-acetyltransferase [unclassified Marinobacter]|uniref:tRNA(Met) cytidine acetyltransferase TmcA n=1 Tax=unclassified Marinobacter TaxID=83889 RepID=UPI00200DA2D4|nr:MULTISPECIES: GNAT family N-acetyltransferase [unclassified Marinobacter]UQG55736.1 GNAT family N-acetyltransferase [Marinobacter sp. M4C]UQG64540.1 GNAT family N-acetyltransferase [Marinobacter sp. M2C]UQG68819.1 GNAT family N-acetyltransferase [Marinobacter sp. M1C]